MLYNLGSLYRDRAALHSPAYDRAVRRADIERHKALVESMRTVDCDCEDCHSTRYERAEAELDRRWPNGY